MAKLPNIKGEYIVNNDQDFMPPVNYSGTGAILNINFEGPYLYKQATPGLDNHTNGFTFDASRCSKVYDDSISTIQPPAIQLIPQLRY